MQSMDNDSFSGSLECTQFSNSSYDHNLPNWLKSKLNQVAPFVLGKQAKYPLEFWHKIVGLPNNGCLLEDVPSSIVSSSEIYELFYYPKHDSFKKLSISQLKNDIQAKEFVEWHKKIYCCQPYDGELCQCFVRAYLAHFGGRIKVDWARTAYEYYKRLQAQAAKKDPHLIQVPILALNEQLLALKNLFIEITRNLVSFIQPNAFCCFNLDHSNKKESTNIVCSNSIKKEMSKKLIQNEKNSNLLLKSNNSTIFQENDNNVLSFITKSYQQHLEFKSINMSKTKSLIKPNVSTNDIYKDLCLTGNKQAMIGQQIHGCAKNLIDKNLSMNDNIRSSSLFTLGFVKTHEDDFCDAFGSIKDGLVETSTSESKKGSTQTISLEDDMCPFRICVDKQYLDKNCVSNEVSFSPQICKLDFDLIAPNVNAFPCSVHENSSTMLQNHVKDEGEKFICNPKLSNHEQENFIKINSMILQSNKKNVNFINENSKLQKSNSHSNVSVLHKKEDLIKPRQRIGISILIQKLRKHNNPISIKEEKKEHQIRHHDFQQDIICSSLIEEPNNVQKPLESFRHNNSDSSRTTTTISPPNEKTPLLINAQEKEYGNNREGNNYAHKSHDFTISDKINTRCQENIISTCSSITCTTCDCNSSNSIGLKDEILNDNRFKFCQGNTKCVSGWSKEPNSSHEIMATSILENIRDKKEESSSNFSWIANECIDSLNNAKSLHLNTKISLPLCSISPNTKTTIGTNIDNNNDINAITNVSNFKTNEEISRCYDFQNQTMPTKLLCLEIPPLHLDKVLNQSNKNIKEGEEIHALNVMSGQLESNRIEISGRSLSTCSIQRSDSYFPYCIELSNAQKLMPFTNNHVVNRVQKQRKFCVNLVHHVESCDVKKENNSYRYAIIPNSTFSSTKKSGIVEDLNIQCKQNVHHAYEDDNIKSKDMEEIFNIGDVQKSSQIFKECDRSVKQFGPKNEDDILNAIRSSVPSMKCAQAEYILEKKKAALGIKKTTVEDLIQKGDLQYALNQQLTTIFISKLEAYDKLCSKVKNLALEVSRNEDNHFFVYREELRDKENMIEILQNEIAEFHKVYKDVQVQLDMSNCMLIESLMAMDNLTLDIEKAQKNVEEIIKEESFNQKLAPNESTPNLIFEMKMVDPKYNENPFELPRAMKTMIQIQQNRFRTTIDAKSLNNNNNNKNYNSIIEEILNRQSNKKDEVYMNPTIDVKMSMKSNDSIMPTMATLSHSSKLEDSEKKSIKMATLFTENCTKNKHGLDVNVQTTTCSDDNVLQWLNKNLNTKRETQSKKLNSDKYDNCNNSNTLKCFHPRSNNDVILGTTDSIIDDSFSCHLPSSLDSSCCSIASSSKYFDDILQCKQGHKNEKCDIHGIDLKMVCAYPKEKLSTQNRIRKDIIQRYGACDNCVKEKSIRTKKVGKLKPQPFFQQNARIAKVMTKEEQVFENYKALGYAKNTHNHLNEYDCDLFLSNQQNHIPKKSHNMKVKDQELYKMIDNMMLLNHGNGS